MRYQRPRMVVCVSAFMFSLNLFAGQGPITTKVVKSADESSIEAQFTFTGATMHNDGKGFISVEQTGAKDAGLPSMELTRVNEEGSPDVFTAGVLIAVPNGFEPKLTINNVEQNTVNAGAAIAPFHQRFRCSVNKGLEAGQYDEFLYKSTLKYPMQNIAIEEVGYLQDVRLVRLAFYPVQMDFAQNAVNTMSKASVRVDLVQKKDGAYLVEQLSPTMSRLVSNLTVNGAYSKRFAPHSRGERMLIITADQYASGLSEFVAWKQSKGMTVDVVNYSTAGGSKEAVLAYVQNDYNTNAVKPTYLLLVGNGTSMPPFRRSTSSGSAASDYPFTLLSGNDIVPDVINGRLLADSATQLQIQLRKWIDYEQRPEVAADWYTKGSTIASDEGSSPSDVDYVEMIQESLKTRTYTFVDQFYQGEGTATAAKISAAVNEGRSWITYIGHGSGTSWGSTNNTFDNNTVGNLTNSRLPIIVDVACLNGSFVDMSTCFAEKWVTHTANGVGAGAVGYYGASVSTSWDPPAIMATGIAEQHFAQSIASQGGSMLAGQLYLIQQMGTGSGVVDNLEWYNLLGDPSMTMRTSIPE